MASPHPAAARDDEPAAKQARSGGSHALASLFDLSPSAIAVIDAGTLRCVYANAAYHRLLGAEGQVVGRPVEDTWPSADAGALAFLRRAISTGDTVHAAELEFRTGRLDGIEPRWLTISFVPTRDVDGLVEGVLLTATDVTRYVQARARTAASHALTEALSGARTRAEVARVVLEKGLAVLGADAGALVLACEDAPGEVEIVEQFGYPAPLVEAWRRFPLTLHSPVTQAIRTAEPVWVPSRRAALEAYPAWAAAVSSGRDRAWAALPLVIDGTLLGALGLGYHQDRPFDDEYRSLMPSVAHRCAQALARAHALDRARASEAALRGANERLRLAQEAAGIGIHVYDVDSGCIGWDARVRELWGVSPDEPVTYDTFMSGVHPDDRAATQAAVDRALDPAGTGAYRAEFRVRSRVYGTERWVAATGQVEFDGARPVRLVGTVLDVTERRRAEEALRTSQERLVLALAAGRVGIWEWDLRAKTVYWTPETHEIMGFPPGEFPGDEQAFFDLVHPDDRAGLSERLQAAFERSEPYAHQFRILRPGGTVRWVSNVGRVLRDESGSPAKMVGTVRDITDEREAEAALRDLDRRRTEFLAVLSHELRNPLAPLRNSLVLLDRATPGSDVDRRAREVLRRQTNQLSRLVDDLLDVARIANGKVQLQLARIDARDVVRRTCDDLRSLYEQRGVALRYTEAAEPAWVDADAARLSQMVGNLLHNALKFTPPGGRVEVLVERREETCEIAVRDTGVGIAADELPRVFAPFMQAERTRVRSQGGLGIGLSLVQELATRHGGAVQASSAGVGHGAEFTLKLPMRAPPPGESTSTRPAPASARLSVLVVEDNADAGATLVDLLELMGHSARLATRGRDGVREALRELPDVLLCDLGLPDVSGHDVIREIRSRAAGALFGVALTGYAQPGDLQEALAAGFDAHLAKPPDLDQLAALLATVASRKAAAHRRG